MRAWVRPASCLGSERRNAFLQSNCGSFRADVPDLRARGRVRTRYIANWHSLSHSRHVRLFHIYAKAGTPFSEYVPDESTPELLLAWGQRVLAYAGRFRQSWCAAASATCTTPIDLFSSRGFDAWLAQQPEGLQVWLRTVETLSSVANTDTGDLFCQCIPSPSLSSAAGAEEASSGSGIPQAPWSVLVRTDYVCSSDLLRVPWPLAAIPSRIPPGAYALRRGCAGLPPSAIALAWALGTYTFDAYKTRESRALRQLQWQVSDETKMVESFAEAAYLVRDLINAPAEQLGPAALEACARALADRYRGSCRAIIGEALRTANFPQIYAVGRAAASRHAPRLVEMHFPLPEGRSPSRSPPSSSSSPNASKPLIVLIGKGVCFDSGGLDIKPAQAMRLMKKDMGGAAHVLGLANLLRSDPQLAERHRLCVLLPAVENAISGDALRPGDILTARNGMTTEVGNTDAEGRLILADALAYAMELNPQYIVDFATLTGAARVALGTDLPALFCSDEQVAREAMELGSLLGDPVWHMPLHRAYRKMLRSKVADIQNIGDSPYAGAILAALYLAEFVQTGREALPSRQSPETAPAAKAADGSARGSPVWIHLDLMAYAVGSSAGRPEGGTEQGLYTMYHLLRRRVLGAEVA
jgi:leucyl aminopeptidase